MGRSVPTLFFLGRTFSVSIRICYMLGDCFLEDPTVIRTFNLTVQDSSKRCTVAVKCAYGIIILVNGRTVQGYTCKDTSRVNK